MKEITGCFAKCIFALIVLLSIGENGISQKWSEPLTAIQVKYKTAIIFVQSKTSKGIIQSNGCGFIINGNYIATCYHLYKSDPSDEPMQMKVLYNITQDSVYHYDSVMVDLNYEYTSNQYNFKKHEFLTNDPRTDFIILKLVSPVVSAPPEIDTAAVNSGDVTYTSGYSLLHYTGTAKYDFAASALHVRYILDMDNMGGKLIGATGTGREGFSGSPLFNTAGRIVGIIQSEINDNDSLQYYFLPLLIKGYINQQTYNDIIGQYSYQDVHLINSLSAEYFLKQYMQGFY